MHSGRDVRLVSWEARSHVKLLSAQMASGSNVIRERLTVNLLTVVSFAIVSGNDTLLT